MTNLTTREEILAALAWQVEIGVDEALEETPADWKAAKPLVFTPRAAVTAPATAEATTAPATPAAPPKPVVDLSRVNSLETLKTAMEGIEGLSIKQTAMNMVFGEGPQNPEIMFIGEAPGEDEDRSGRPFVGKAGQLLEKMLKAIGIVREQVYITNVLRWRPPGNRTPKTDEVAVCLPYLLRHIELVQPKLIVCLGGPASKALLNKDETVTRLRGQWHEHAGTPVLVTYHPAYLLRTPAQKREAWKDLRLLLKKLPPRA